MAGGRLCELFAMMEDENFIRKLGSGQERLYYFSDWKTLMKLAYKFKQGKPKHTPKRRSSLPWQQGVPLVSEQGESYIGKDLLE